MVTRKISTLGEPLLSPDGEILKNESVVFVLVDDTGRPSDVFDVETGERISGAVYIKTDDNGEFEVDLFPNTRGDRPTYYLVRVVNQDIDDFTAALQEGDTTISLLEFKYGGQDITAAEYNLIQDYLDNFTSIDDGNLSLESTWSSQKIYDTFYNTSAYYTHTQETPSTEWVIDHNLDRPVNAVIYDDEGFLIVGSIQKLSFNTIKIIFSEPVAGEAYIR